MLYNTALLGHSYHFIDEREDVIWEVRALEISTSPSTLSGDTLGNGVVGDQSDWTVHLPHDLLEGSERGFLRSVQVRLIHFIGEEDEIMLLAEFYEFLLRFLV